MTPTIDYCKRHGRLYPKLEGCRECRIQRNWDRASVVFFVAVTLFLVYAFGSRYLDYYRSLR